MGGGGVQLLCLGLHRNVTVRPTAAARGYRGDTHTHTYIQVRRLRTLTGKCFRRLFYFFFLGLA